jgi:uncharacterized membrane protein YdbT with pleckstrin-like domain
MRLSEDRLPTGVLQARRGYLFGYLFSLALIVLAALGLLQRLLPQVPALAYGIAGGIGVVWLAGLEINRLVNRLRIHKDKLELGKGLLSVTHVTLYYAQITDVRIYQSLWQRLLRYGTIYFNTAGDDEYELFLDKVSDPHAVRVFIEQMKQRHERHPPHAKAMS